MKKFYLIFTIALFVDLLVLPSLGALFWWPWFSIALLPFAFLFASEQAKWVFFVVTSIIFWLTTAINLGIIVFSFGASLFFLTWFVPKVFHKDAWQTLLVSSLGVIIFAAFLGLGVTLLMPTESFFNTSTLFSLFLTTIISIFITYIFRSFIYKNVINV